MSASSRTGGTPDPEGANDGFSPDGGGGATSDRGEGGEQEKGAAGAVLVLRPRAEPDVDRRAAKLPMTDLGNAERFVLRHGADFRFCAELGWFRFDGRRWELLSEEKDKLPAPVMQAIFATVRAIKNEALLVRESGLRNSDDPDSPAMDFVVDAKKGVNFSDKLADWARQSESNGRMTAIGMIAKSFASIAVKVDDFDRDRHAINCLNGTLRLQMVRQKRTAAEIALRQAQGERVSEWHSVWGVKLHPHRREDLISKICRVAYRPNASAPTYDRFLEQVQPDAVMRRFISQWGGYSLTGDIGEQKMAFFYGQGRNGKGVWVETVAWLAGDYAGTLPIDSLLDNGKRRGDQATPDIARLPGVRFLRVSEPQKGSKFNDGLIKELTGGDPVNARHLNKGMFTFFPEFKPTISGNNRPRVSDTSVGMWERMQLVPWDVIVPKEQRDLKLGAKLQAEGEGIFARLIAGLIDWRINGLIVPDAVRRATAKYQDDSDDIGKFLRQCCETGEHSRADPFKVNVTELHELYLAWANEFGAYAYDKKPFATALEGKGFVRSHSGGSVWLGVRPVVNIQDIKEGQWVAADDDGAAGDAPDGGGSGGEIERDPWEGLP